MIGKDLGILLLILDWLGSLVPDLLLADPANELLAISIALSWVVAGLLTGSYQIDNLDRIHKIIIRSMLSAILYYGLIFLMIGLRTGAMVPAGESLLIFFATFLPLVLLKVFLHRLIRVLSQLYPSRKNAIIIGRTPRGKELSRHFLMTTSLPIQYLGYFSNTPATHEEDIPFYLGALKDVKEYCLEKDVKEIYYALDQQRQYFKELMDFADQHFIFLGIVPDMDGMDFSRRVDTMLYNDSRIPVIASRRVPLRLEQNQEMKRAFDVVFSAIVLLILSLTLFPFIALAIKLSSPGPIFFKQLRPGRNNKLFWCYKFRTMRVNNEDQKQATKNDSRITRIGAFLRKTSLDELPQFYNVLKGEMSVVGPRPNLVVHLQEYPKEIKEYSLRHWVTPGITGFAQVSGYRGETRETILMQKRVDHDLQYIENWSLGLDMKIIGKTVVNMVKGEKEAY
ncbi:exopolysaccharide biosynthesis polyprenyl glycosylphosphotransferase [Cesiribacter andamanensis]|uniref:exopolysaccharide biosynthesis polyprenyl glycosylphosphotransferase n=1 Tax=Cesiribacter andamanensis TaxID=649507 RepID=UPI00034A220F|nr:exopolysaccharide biosynthesis polyprenyl glycosylphosphotransferase [Cesiribacter andamanensis]